MFAALPLLASVAVFASMPDGTPPKLKLPNVPAAVPSTVSPAKPPAKPAAPAPVKPAPPATAPAPVAPPPKPVAPPAKIKLPPSFTDDPNKLAKDLSLSDEQVTKLRELRKQRDEALTKLIETDTKRLALMKERLGAMKTGAERAKADIVLAEKQHQTTLASMASTHERDMFAVLTEEQRGKYNAPSLSAEVAKSYKPLNLTEDQVKQITTLCEIRGREMTSPTDLKLHEGILKGLKAQAFTGVLTADQRRTQIQSAAPKKK